ncbi:MAG: nucleotide sugar dehydrogenase [Methylococcaceae bacterium]|nr:nucleotide sugar dehydrogenase [Methylococcaceae bacterium]
MEDKICIVGLGYVGLPLAVEFGQKFQTIGFDLSKQRIDELAKGYDKTMEIGDDYLIDVVQNHRLTFTTSISDARDFNIYIVTVPTPLDKNKRPDLTPLISASNLIGSVLKLNDIVIYESTVYPGATEEDCVPILEQVSGLTFNKDFFCGYSPERINPGDKEHTVSKILKVTSGSTPEIAQKVDVLYQKIISAGTHLAPSIKVAEAAKVIENTQRYINIAFVNELAMLFNRLGIDTQAVLEAANTKWNFLPFKPGLVGGHCIGVDPYYLTHKAQEIGFNPEIILAGRHINDGMGSYIANRVIKLMIKKCLSITQSKVLIMGITFKENCPDIRNSRVIDVIIELQDFGVNVDIYDPWANVEDVHHEYGIKLIGTENGLCVSSYDAVVLAVAHKQFETIQFDRTDKQIIFDIKTLFDQETVDGRL